MAVSSTSAAPTAGQPLDDFLGVQPPSPRTKYLKWAAVAVGVVLLLLLLARCFGGSAATDYSTQVARRGDLTVTVSATGKLAPTNQVEVGSQLSGLVTKVVVDVNDRVTAGQPLALIDPEQLDDQIRAGNAQLAANQAQVGQAQATVAESQAQLGRLEQVYKASNGRVPSTAELQTGRATYQRAVAAQKVAEANVVAARAQLAQSQTQRGRAIIRSPVSGVVLARVIEPGQTVAASLNSPTLFVIAEDLTKMKLEVAIDEADVGSVKAGQRASFAVDAFPGRTFPATIARVDLGSNLSATSSTSTTSTTATVVSYAATLTVANANEELRPGMTATADIVTTEKNGVLLVPNAALRFRPNTPNASASSGGITGALVRRGPRPGGGSERTVTTGRGAQQTVYVKGDDGQPKRVNVVTGDSDGRNTEVTGGDLRPGMAVITGQLSGGDDASGSGQRRRRSGSGGSGSGGSGSGSGGGQRSGGGQ